MISTFATPLTDGRRVHVVTKDGVAVKVDGYVFTGQDKQQAINSYEHYMRDRDFRPVP